MKKFLFILPLLLLAVMVLPVAAQVVPSAPTAGGIGTTPVGGTNIGQTGGISTAGDLVTLILGLVNWIAWLIALAAVVFGLYAGFLFITAGGDEGNIETAKNIMIYAVIGIVVAILAFSIVSISRSITGIV
ncbi:MAG: hypothetical protein AAB614_00515 [Patescibacteria group bacterium]